jgi:ubiquinone/menaquinone biosynthesis C-methylase UbiE
MLDHGPIAERRVREVLSSIETAPARILDYGCGRGAWIPSLARAFPSAQIVGLETSAKALDHAKRDFPDFRFLLFDGRYAPFEDESFDLVFSYHVLEHVLDLSLTIADMARLVRPQRPSGDMPPVRQCGLVRGANCPLG